MIWRNLRALCVAVAALALLIGLAETLAQERARLTPEQLLERIPEEPDILINVSAYAMPATSDIMRLGNAATPALVNCLINNLDAYARVVCANVLVATRDVRAIHPLIAALDDPEPAVRSWAIDALAEIESRPATARLLELLEEPKMEGSFEREIVRALGRSGDPAAVAPLLERFTSYWDGSSQRALWDMRSQLTDEQLRTLLVTPFTESRSEVSREVLEFAIERAGDLQLTELVEPLIEYYPEAYPSTQNRIIYNLGRIGDPAAIPFIESQIDLTGEARLLNNVTFALQRLGVDVLPLLRTGLADQRAYIRYNMAFVAGDLRAPLVPELLHALEDVNDIVRSEAALALGRVGDASAIPGLEKATRDVNPIVRRDAWVALLRLDHERFRSGALEELRKTQHDGVRRSLITALGESADPRLVTDIITSLSPSEYRQVELGLAFLDQFETLDNVDAIAWLVQVAADSWSHKAFILLARFADPSTSFMFEQWILRPRGETEQLLRGLGALKSTRRRDLAQQYLEAERRIVQLYAAGYFIQIGETEALSVLIDALESAPIEFKRTAAIIFTRFDVTALPGAKSALVELLDHRDVYTRLYAARALAHSGVSEGLEHLRRELDKQIPFIRDEVLSIVDRLPDAHRRPLLESWIPTVDRMLRRDLEQLLARPRSTAP